MDKNTFDALVRGFGSRRSRRSAVIGLAAGVLGLGATKSAAAQFGPEALTCGQFCEGDAECNAGLRCGAVSEECFARPDSKARCNSNGDCIANYETCNSNDRCVNTLAPENCAECLRNGDCPVAGSRCTNGRCIEPECINDEDCRRRQRCRRGICVD